MVEHCLEKIYLELEVMKANNGGTLPYGAISKKVEEHKNILTWLDLNQVYNHLRKKYKQQREALAISNYTSKGHTVDDSVFNSELSTLTDSQQTSNSFERGNFISDHTKFASAMVTESATTNEQLTFSNGNGATIASKESTMSVSAHGG